MIDAGDEVASALYPVLHAEGVEQPRRAGLNRVAEADGLYVRVSLHISRQHCHRVGVVEEPCVGADLLDILRKAPHNGNGAERAEYSADAERVADSLTDAVLLRYLKVDNGARLISADLNCVDDEIRTGKRVFPFGDPEMLCDLRLAAVYAPVEGVDHYV